MQELGKSDFPSIKKLVVRDIRVIMDKLLFKAITVAFLQLKVIEIIDCDFDTFCLVEELIFNQWEKDKPSLVVSRKPLMCSLFIYNDSR